MLERYSLADLGDWLDMFFRHPDPFIQSSGHGFNIFSACIGKCITARPRPKAIEPPPPAPVVELAKSIARQRAEEAEQSRVEIDQRVQQLIGLGISEPSAVMQASQEWLKRQ